MHRKYTPNGATRSATPLGYLGGWGLGWHSRQWWPTFLNPTQPSGQGA